jgi:hypothetical protein
LVASSPLVVLLHRGLIPATATDIFVPVPSAATDIFDPVPSATADNFDPIPSAITDAILHMSTYPWSIYLFVACDCVFLF